MKIRAQSTDRVVQIELRGGAQLVPARVWEAITDDGVRCYLAVTRIAVHNDDDQSRFERELEVAHVAPTQRAIEAFPLRMFLD